MGLILKGSNNFFWRSEFEYRFYFGYFWIIFDKLFKMFLILLLCCEIEIEFWLDCEVFIIKIKRVCLVSGLVILSFWLWIIVAVDGSKFFILGLVKKGKWEGKGKLEKMLKIIDYRVVFVLVIFLYFWVWSEMDFFGRKVSVGLAVFILC